VNALRVFFTSTDLQQRLDTIGVRRVVVCGMTTDQCCETTTRVAADLGYDVDFVTEATATFPIGTLSTEAIVERTEAVLRGRFARIVTVSEVRGEVMKELLVSAT
jgi:nicotinamidase-related amidase